MRVLWFTPSSSNFEGGEKNKYNGGGWIRSLESEICKNKDIQLAVSFYSKNGFDKCVQHGVTYYPMVNKPYSLMSKILCKYHFNNFEYERREWNNIIEQMQQVINDFNPDIIEIFGTELPFSLIGTKTSIPVVVHIQGLLTPYWDTYLYPKMSHISYVLFDWNPIRMYYRFLELQGFKRSSWREKEEVKRVSHFIGRTEWSKSVINAMNPTAVHHYGGEILRDVFYEDSYRTIPSNLIIVSTLSKPMYKGFDMVLKTARILKESYEVDFCWKVFGNVDPLIAENVTGIKHEEVNVQLVGVIDANILRNEMLNASVYVHTSYIDNSPNSVCEAQILGLPVVATNVGGLSSLIKEGQTGYLVPANDPYQMAFKIDMMFKDKNLNEKIGMNAKMVAVGRHDKKTITDELIKTYINIINKCK